MRKSVGPFIRRTSFVALATAAAVMMTGCGGGGGGDGGASPAPTGNPPGGTPGTGTGSPPSSAPGGNPGASNRPPTITATPATAATVGKPYDLAPTAQDADGDTLAFSVANRPAWATFNTATGRLSGTPQAVGTAADVLISVSDGKSSVALPAFTITVAAATSSAPPPVSGKAVALSWDVPTRTVDGGTLNDLSGYRVHYGRSAAAMTESVEIQSAGANMYTVQVPKAGTYYFAVRAITADGSESSLSNVISRTIS